MITTNLLHNLQVEETSQKRLNLDSHQYTIGEESCLLNEPLNNKPTTEINQQQALTVYFELINCIAQLDFSNLEVNSIQELIEEKLAINNQSQDQQWWASTSGILKIVTAASLVSIALNTQPVITTMESTAGISQLVTRLIFDGLKRCVRDAQIRQETNTPINLSDYQGLGFLGTITVKWLNLAAMISEQSPQLINTAVEIATNILEQDTKATLSQQLQQQISDMALECANLALQGIYTTMEGNGITKSPEDGLRCLKIDLIHHGFKTSLINIILEESFPNYCKKLKLEHLSKLRRVKV